MLHNVTHDGEADEMCARLKQINKLIERGEMAFCWGIFVTILYSKVVYKRMRHK